MYRSENGSEMRLGKTLEHYATFDHQWVPHQVKRGDLVLIHDMVSFPVENQEIFQKPENLFFLPELVLVIKNES